MSTTELRPLILVMGAMDSEIAPLRAKMKILRTLKERDFSLYLGTYKNLDILLVRSGVGTKKLAAAFSVLKEWHAYKFKMALLIGLCGAVVPGPDVGDIVIPEFITYSKKRLNAAKELYTKSCSVDLKGVNIIKEGGIISVRTTAPRETKQKLAKDHSGANAVDMESGPFAEYFLSLKIPFLIIKSVSDGADFEFPKLEFVRERMSDINWSRALPHFLRRPKEFLLWLRIMLNIRKAVSTNSNFLLEFLKGVK